MEQPHLKTIRDLLELADQEVAVLPSPHCRVTMRRKHWGQDTIEEYATHDGPEIDLSKMTLSTMTDVQLNLTYTMPRRQLPIKVWREEPLNSFSIKIIDGENDDYYYLKGNSLLSVSDPEMITLLASVPFDKLFFVSLNLLNRVGVACRCVGIEHTETDVFFERGGETTIRVHANSSHSSI